MEALTVGQVSIAVALIFGGLVARRSNEFAIAKTVFWIAFFVAAAPILQWASATTAPLSTVVPLLTIGVVGDVAITLALLHSVDRKQAAHRARAETITTLAHLLNIGQQLEGWFYLEEERLPRLVERAVHWNDQVDFFLETQLGLSYVFRSNNAAEVPLYTRRSGTYRAGSLEQGWAAHIHVRLFHLSRFLEELSRP
jgi:hypothetical protein